MLAGIRPNILVSATVQEHEAQVGSARNCECICQYMLLCNAAMTCVGVCMLLMQCILGRISMTLNRNRQVEKICHLGALS